MEYCTTKNAQNNAAHSCALITVGQPTILSYSECTACSPSYGRTKHIILCPRVIEAGLLSAGQGVVAICPLWPWQVWVIILWGESGEPLRKLCRANATLRELSLPLAELVLLSKCLINTVTSAVQAVQNTFLVMGRVCCCSLGWLLNAAYPGDWRKRNHSPLASSPLHNTARRLFFSWFFFLVDCFTAPFR